MTTAQRRSRKHSIARAPVFGCRSSKWPEGTLTADFSAAPPCDNGFEHASLLTLFHDPALKIDTVRLAIKLCSRYFPL